MGIITRKDLQYEYSDVAVNGDNPKITGNPDRKKLNRNEGYEMVSFINHFCETYNLMAKKQALEIEKLLHEELPSKMVMKDEIENWLIEKLNLKE